MGIETPDAENAVARLVAALQAQLSGVESGRIRVYSHQFNVTEDHRSLLHSILDYIGRRRSSETDA